MNKISFEEVKAIVTEKFFSNCLETEFKNSSANKEELEDINLQFEKADNIEELACVLDENGYQDYEAYEFIITSLMND